MGLDSDVKLEDIQCHSLLLANNSFCKKYYDSLKKFCLLLLHSKVKGQVRIGSSTSRASRDSTSCSRMLQRGEILLTRGLEPGLHRCGMVNLLRLRVHCVR